MSIHDDYDDDEAFRRWEHRAEDPLYSDYDDYISDSFSEEEGEGDEVEEEGEEGENGPRPKLTFKSNESYNNINFPIPLFLERIVTCLEFPPFDSDDIVQPTISDFAAYFNTHFEANPRDSKLKLIREFCPAFPADGEMKRCKVEIWIDTEHGDSMYRELAISIKIVNCGRVLVNTCQSHSVAT